MAWAERHMTDVEAVITFNVRVYGARYGTTEYFEKLERLLNREIDDLNEFIRDHRSRDDYHIETRRVYGVRCRHCGWVYDDASDPDSVFPECCDAAIDEYGYKLVEVEATHEA